MKTYRGRQETGPSQGEEWKLLHFMFKKVKFTAITMSQLCHPCCTRPEHLQRDRLNENHSREQAGVPLNSDFISCQSKQGANMKDNLNVLTRESLLCLS